ncbi:MAG: sporulation integral membrane protein YtvI [Clostridiales bacterium]|jgi:sporulation integral membrane protein YtvI|nr:sporulation integral membrane protein YtvI [Clostridiales bacterium]
MLESKEGRFIQKMIYIASILIVCWLAFRYLLPGLMPFLIAFLAACIMEPLVRTMTVKLRLKRWFAAFLCTAVMLSFLIGLTVLAAGRILYEASSFIKQLPKFLSPFLSIFRGAEERLYEYIIAAPPEVQSFFQSTLNSLLAQSSELPTMLYSKLFAFLTSVIGSMPSILFFAVTFGMSLFFISGGYPTVRDFIQQQIPANRQVWFKGIKSGFFDTLGSWLRAQLALMGITFSELTIAFLILRIDYAVILALLISFIDALPVLGTSIILIPWIIVCIITGALKRAAFLSITLLLVTLVRSFLEPKFLGSRTGLHPVATLVAIYLGFRVSGILGMVFFPIVLMLLKQFNDKGYIRLWK